MKSRGNNFTPGSMDSIEVCITSDASSLPHYEQESSRTVPAVVVSSSALSCSRGSCLLHESGAVPATVTGCSCYQPGNSACVAAILVPVTTPTLGPSCPCGVSRSINSHRDAAAGITRRRDRRPRDCCRFWTLVSSSHVQYVHSHRDKGIPVAKCRNIVTFGRISCRGGSKVSAVTGIRGAVVTKRKTVINLDSPLVLASQKCQE